MYRFRQDTLYTKNTFQTANLTAPEPDLCRETVHWPIQPCRPTRSSRSYSLRNAAVTS